MERQSVTLDADTRRMSLTLPQLLLTKNTEIVVLILRAGDSDVHPLLPTPLKYLDLSTLELKNESDRFPSPLLRQKYNHIYKNSNKVTFLSNMTLPTSFTLVMILDSFPVLEHFW